MEPLPRAFLVLADGTVLGGRGFGALAPTVSDVEAGWSDLAARGEVVFNTAMSGYHEVLTDPSYSGQVVVMTYPHMGNYGDLDAWSETGPEQRKNQRPVKVAAYVVRSLYRGPVPRGRISLSDFLSLHGIPGISDVDTRALTLHLRDNGSQNGMVVSPEAGDQLSQDEIDGAVKLLADFPAMEGRNLVPDVGVSEVQSFNQEGSPHVALLDCGLKQNILRELLKLNCRVSLVPATTTLADIQKLGAGALFMSNGPGDPATQASQVQLVQDATGVLPVLGICLGHQIISQALGAKTVKMKFGHHGINHPVRDERTKKVFVTSQNHGFVVDEGSLPSDVEVWFRNANDKTIEGIRSDSRKVACVQFHPESAPGPHDSLWIFEDFLSLV